MVIAVWLVEIDRVDPFRRTLITLIFFWPARDAAQCYSIRFERSAVSEERQPARRFFEQNAIHDGIAGQGIEVQVSRNRQADGSEAKDEQEKQNELQCRQMVAALLLNRPAR